MSANLKPHTELELAVAKSLFDAYQRSLNQHPDTIANHGRYCETFDHLERRLKQAWLDTAKSVINVSL